MTTAWTQLSDWPFSWETMNRLCARLAGIMPPVTLTGRQVKLHSFRVGQRRTDWTEQPCAHWAYEAHLFLHGTGRYTYESTQPVGPGSLLLHPPGRVHSWSTESTPVVCFVLRFFVTPVIAVPETTPWPVCPELIWQIGLLLKEVQDSNNGWQERAVAHLTALLSRILLLASHDIAPPDDHAFESSLVARVDTYLLEHLAERVTLERICSDLVLSERSLIRHFRLQTGDTVMQRLDAHRLERMEHLLGKTALPLAEIGAQIGFRDTAYLANWFRRQKQMTPMQFRKMLYTQVGPPRGA